MPTAHEKSRRWMGPTTASTRDVPCMHILAMARLLVKSHPRRKLLHK